MRVPGDVSGQERSLSLLFSLPRLALALAEHPHGRLLRTSPAFAALVGRGEAALAGTRLDELVHPDDRVRLVRLGPAPVELRLLRSAGEALPVTVTAQGVSAGPPDGGLLLLAQESTETERLSRELAACREQLAHTDRRHREFLATLSHELRNPLAPIRNVAQVLRFKAAMDSEVQQAGDMIERQVDHLTQLVDDLLDVSRISHDKIDLDLQPLRLSTLLEYSAEITRPLMEARQHAFTLSLDEGEIYLLGDATRLTQAISNLLTNAAKFTEPGGAISLTAERSGQEVVVRVRDNGIGMPPELLRDAFEPFIQGDRSLDRGQGGLGIGLSLVKRLVELHGGTVLGRSEGAGRGSEFEIRLPVRSDVQPPAAPPPASPRQGPGQRILVVDDNKDAADSTAALLRLEGHVVQTAYSGPAALGAARVFRPGVILLDLGLPGMDGFEVARRVREFPETRDAQIIATTGYGQSADRERSREAGFDRHLVKPVDLDQLLGILRDPAG